ncbi:MAG: acyl-CoA dehydrogenase family protein, partial [Hyphomonadaceae bacterium]|nr:acyl-CoA dehydrogenase family protein [Hyphomonadaceae bacterium]
MSRLAEQTSATALADLQGAARAACAYLKAAAGAMRQRLAPQGRIDRAALDREQHAAHGLAWIATYAEALRETAAWAQRLDAQGGLAALELGLARLLFGEYLAQLTDGLPMWANEFVRPADLGVEDAAATLAADPAVASLIREGRSIAAKAALAPLLRDALGRATVENTGLDGEMNLIREQFRRFAEEKVVPHAHDWHLNDDLIPLPLIEALAELGVFGLTIPEAFGGLGLSKLAMCVVSEELSRGYIGVGSLGTRSEIAAELILAGGTPEQKAHWLPQLASAALLPTAVFTEPNTGSDLGSLRTRAVKQGETYQVFGAKTWITHGARADLMTLLVRTDPASKDYRGLSMFLAEKPRGSDAEPFPATGMSGGEIAVLGYRGMKEYEIGFDGFAVPAANLLGLAEGQGFKQLMATFESARIQT